MTDRASLIAALKVLGYEVLTAKGGGFWIRKNSGPAECITTTKARKLTGIKAEPRAIRPRMLPGGEWGAIAAINGRLNG